MKLVQISNKLQLTTCMSAQELRRELAVHLYARGKLSIGKAGELAEMSIAGFQFLLGSRGIPVNYRVEDFVDDLSTVQKLHLDQRSRC